MKDFNLLKIIIFLAFTFIFLVNGNKVAAEARNIVINEIMANPVGVDTGNEWIELYNPSLSQIKLDGWVIKDKTSLYSLNGLTIDPNNFLIIFPSISLNNTDETITLTDNQGYEDILNYSESVEAISLERINSECEGFKQHTSSHTQGSINLSYDINFCETEENIETTPEPKILLNELMPDPEGSDSGNEWIELYNPNDFDIHLKDWTIGVGSKSQVIEDIAIKAKGFTVINSKVSLTNTSAEITLTTPNKIVSDSFQYSETEMGKSWARKLDGEGEWIISEPTKGITNKVIEITESKDEKITNEEVESLISIDLKLSPPDYLKLNTQDTETKPEVIKTLEVNKSGFAGLFGTEIIVYLTLVLKKEELANIISTVIKLLKG